MAEDAVIAHNMNGTLMAWNSGAEQLFGYRPDEILGTSISKLIPSQSQAAHTLLLQRIHTGQPVHKMETVWHTADGSAIPISLTALPILHPEGLTTGVILLISNQSSNSSTELELSKERQRAKRYLDIAQAILLELDTVGRVTLANRYACSVLGWSEEELLGRDWFRTFLPTRIQEQLLNTFSTVLRGDSEAVDNPVLTKSGEERLIEWRNSTLRDENGAVIGTLSSGTDITERHRSAEALRITEERMRFALDAAGIGVWDMDYTTGVLHWSEILEGQYGLKSGTFGRSFEEFVDYIHPDDRVSTVNTIMAAVKAGGDFSTLHRIIWPDGTVRWMRGNGRIHLNGNGKPVRGNGISQDVTERKQAEAEFERLNNEIQLQRLHIFKATMNTVQDIVNNFLNGLQLIQIEAEGSLPKTTEAMIEQSIRQTTTQLNALANLDTITEREMTVGPGIDFSSKLI